MEGSGALNNIPYKVEFADFAAATPLLEAENAEAIDAGFGGDAAHALAFSNGIQSKVIYAEKSDPACIGILVRGNSPYRSIADLKGKTITTGRGTIAHYLAIAAMKANGMSPSDINFVFLQPADAKSAFVSGSVDAWAIWTLYIAQAVLTENARVIANGRGLINNNAFISASNTAIAQKRAILHDFANRYARSRVWALKNIDTYSKVWADLVKVTPEAAKYAYELERFRPVNIDDQLLEEFQKAAAFQREMGLITKPFTPSDFLDRSFKLDPEILASVPT